MMMQHLSPAEEHALNQMQLSLNTDFTAILLLSKTDGKLHVIFHIGSRSKRTGKLSFKTNEGIAEPVFKSGRVFSASFNTSHAAPLFHSCPLLLAERLTSIISVPLFQSQSLIGLLLTGTRYHSRTFHHNEIQHVQKEASNLSSSMPTIPIVI
ncbi:GAF domain-containing protein [Paenibacillus sp. Marseille-Q4541]|uniref:GAF domain-containing protein n=1 Tax=Paenibacillus sp. Marseille-Q4541 TaxID=2831522 RepID=UPI001BA4832A|nr:GAF domain-containing protein [Paenibacillus sp. Marseille-Q4541]